MKNKRKRNQNVQVKLGEDLNFAAIEAFNFLRTSLSFSVPGKKTGKVFGVTSAVQHDGKSFTSINLAYAMAKKGMKVLLIDADMRCSNMATTLQLPPQQPGLSEVLSGNCGEELPIIHGALNSEMDLLVAGSVPPNPSELLDSDNMRDLIARMSEQYDVVLLDLPPVNPVADAMILSGQIDGYVIVLLHNYTTKKNIKEAIHRLTLAEAKILGFVYNGFTRGSRHYGKYGKYGHYGHYGHYGDYYSAGNAEKPAK